MDAFPEGAGNVNDNDESDAPVMVIDKGADGNVVTYNILLAIDVPLLFVAVIVNG